MNDDMLARIRAHPKYEMLVRRRRRFAGLLTTAMLGVYYGYVGLIAFDKELLARPIGSSVISVGIPVGLGLIVFTILITAAYVIRANSEFDRVTREIVEDAGQ